MRRGPVAKRCVHGDEPLRRGEEDHRIVAPPAVRVRVLERRAMPEARALVQRLFDARVRVEHALAAEEFHVLKEVTARPDRRVDVQPVLHAGREVVAAMARRRVHRARPLLERDVVGEHRDRMARIQGVLEPQPLELGPLHARDRLAERASRGGGDALGQRLGDDHDAAIHFVRAVIELGVKRDRQIRRDRPGGRRPDQHRHGASVERRRDRRQGIRALRRQRELDVDRRRRVFRVLDLRFGKRRAAVDAPVHRFLALVDQPLLDEPSQRARDGRLVPEVHRQVEVVPVAEHAKALEFGAHDADEPRGVVAAGAAEVRDRHVALLRAQLAVDLQLDRQPVAVVPEHIRGIEAHHRPRFDDDVLEDLVHRRAEVDAAVRVWRPVVQDELRAPGAALADPLVQPHVLPAGERQRLGGLEVRFHGEVRARQIQRIFPVGHG
jgi:hypothetical protein